MSLRRRFPMIRSLLALAGAGLVAGCVASYTPPLPPQPSSLPAPPPARPAVLAEEMAAVPFAELPGWGGDDLDQALAAFAGSCRHLRAAPSRWEVRNAGFSADAFIRACDGMAAYPPSQARSFFEANFQPYRIGRRAAIQGKLTAYASPQVTGHRPPCSSAAAPVYRNPGRVLARADITRGALRGREIACVDDPVEFFDMQIQGAGSILLPGGEVLYLLTDGTNELQSVMPGQMGTTIGALRRMDQAVAAEFMDRNPRYVYYRIANDAAVLGGMMQPLTAGRSMAVDTDILPYGLPVWVQAGAQDGQPALKRLMFAQDAGAKIKGIVRGDYYFGSGRLAIEKARQFGYDTLTFHILLPRQQGTPAIQSAARKEAPVPVTPLLRVEAAAPVPALRGAHVQLGAMSTSGQAWALLNRLEGSLAPGLKAAVEPVEGKNSFRALLTGFPDKDAARDTCNRLKGRGIDCFVRAP